MPAGPGQAFADLLLLAALGVPDPRSLVSVLQAGRTWSTLSYGFETRDGLNDGRLFEAIATSSQPVELTDLMGRVPRSPLVQPPHSMRWAYGVSISDAAGSVIGVVAVLDRWLRQLTKREQRALAAWPASSAAAGPVAPAGRATTRRCCPGRARPGPVPASDLVAVVGAGFGPAAAFAQPRGGRDLRRDRADGDQLGRRREAAEPSDHRRPPALPARRRLRLLPGAQEAV